MNEFIDIAMLEQFWVELVNWFKSTFLGFENTIQIVVIVFVVGLGFLLGGRIRKNLVGTETLPEKQTIIRNLIDHTVPFTSNILILLVLWVIVAIGEATNQYQSHLFRLVGSLLTAWVVIRFFSSFIRNKLLASLISWIVWIIGVLIAFDQLDPITGFLDEVAISFGSVHISLLSIINGIVLLAILLLAVVTISNQIEKYIGRVTDLSPSLQVLIVKLTKIGLSTLVVLILINSFGIDLTALAVFGGALGIGIGLGLQKVISNLFSGILLLLDKSIKPNDVISVGETFGWVEKLGVRFTSVRTRDGIEHIIPNEELISQRVESWSHSDKSVRLRIPIGISYNSDLKRAIDLCIEAANQVARVNSDPAPKCLLRAFGENSLNLEIRVWVDDMTLGRGSVINEILINVWEKFQEHDIQVPYPQRDIHLKSIETPIAIKFSGNEEVKG